MEIKENVGLKLESTEQGNEREEIAQNRECGEKVGSAVLGKFKSVDALAKAYADLQAEFTRRSQKLKDLQRERENAKAGEGVKEDAAAVLGAEKLKKSALARAEEERKFDRFVCEIENAHGFAPEKEKGAQEVGEDIERAQSAQAMQTPTKWNAQEQEAEKEKAEQEKNLENASAAVLSRNDEAKSVEKSRESDGDFEETLYQKAADNERVRLRIIGDYLTSIGKGAPLMKGGAGGALAPKIKAKTLSEAGDMALRLFKGETV